MNEMGILVFCMNMYSTPQCSQLADNYYHTSGVETIVQNKTDRFSKENPNVSLLMGTAYTFGVTKEVKTKLFELEGFDVLCNLGASKNGLTLRKSF